MCYKPDIIDKSIKERYYSKITVNPALYGVTYNEETSKQNSSCYCNKHKEKTNMKNDDTEIDNEISKAIQDKNSIVEKMKTIQELHEKAKSEYKGKKLQERLENLKQVMQDMINPNRMYERLGIDLLQIHVGKNLIPIADPDSGGELLFYTAQLRQDLVDDLGYIIPNIRIMDTTAIQPNEYAFYVRGRKVFLGELPEEDINNKNCDKIIEDLKNVCIKYAHQIMTKTDILKLMELVKSQDPTLVNDLVPIFLSPIDLKKIFANLISQNISIKDIIFVFEILNDHARYTRDVEELTQFVKDELNFVKE